MDLDDRDLKEIEKMMQGMTCHKDFACCRSGFEQLCSARDFGIENYLECLDHGGEQCHHSISFGDLLFCKCPIRYYLVRREKE